MGLPRFIRHYLLFTASVAGLAVLLPRLFDGVALMSPYFWWLFAVVSVLTLTAYIISDLAIRKGGELSIYGLLGGLAVKLCSCLAVVAVLMFKFPENKLLTALNFFSLYFLFTVFEVICLLRNLRDQNQT